MVTCVRGDGKGRAAARAHRGLSLDGEWGERESSQARVPAMRETLTVGAARGLQSVSVLSGYVRMSRATPVRS